MNAIQLPFLVEGLLILATITLGVFLGRAGKPYGKVKLGFHLFLFLWFTVGFGFIVSTLLPRAGIGMIMIPVGLMGVAILTQLVTGFLMWFSKSSQKALPKIHGTSAVVLLVADLVALVLAANLA